MSRLEERLAEEVAASESRAALAALCADLLATQAGRRALTIGRDLVNQRAADHGVTFDSASLPSGNVLSILEQGPDGPVEHGLVAALAVSRLADVPAGGERNDAFDRWVESADWLEVQTDYRVYPYIDLLLTEPVASAFWTRLADGVIAERGQTPQVAARLAVRVSALTAVESEGAIDAARRIGEHAVNPVARALAGSPAPGSTTELEGSLDRPPPGGVRGVLRLVSGFALLQGLVRVLAWAVGHRRRGVLRLTTDGIELAEEHKMFGRVIKDARSVQPFAAVTGLSREVRYPRLLLLAGAAALALGVLVGGVWIAEGVRTGETYLLLVGAVLLLGGAALDLGLSVLPYGRKGRVACRVDVNEERAIRLHGVPLEDADGFIRATRDRLGKGGGRPSEAPAAAE